MTNFYANVNATSNVKAIATRVRQAFEATSKNEWPDHWTQFPRGTCSEASLVLCAFLVDAGFRDFRLICGERGNQENGTYSSHAWLQRDDLVVDITADQFEDAPGAVIVTEASSWHTGFYIHNTDAGDFRDYPITQVYKLHNLYSHLKPHIENALL